MITELDLPLQPQAFSNSSRIKNTRLAIVFSKEFSLLFSEICLEKAVFNEEFANRIPARYENKTSNVVF